MTIKNVLMIDVDLPVFPGGPASEFFGMVYLGKLCQKIGLVSQIHSVEQNHKKQSLSDQGIQLYLWQSDHLWEIPPIGDGKKPPFIRRLGKFAADLWRTGWWRPADTLIQDYQFRNIAVPITKALEEIPWDAIIVIQSSCARYIDFLPHAPVTALVMHDIRSLVYERRSQIAKTFTDWLSAKAEALRYRAFEKKYCHCYDLVITVSEVDEAWVRDYYQVSHVTTLPLVVDTSYFGGMPAGEDSLRIVFTGFMMHPPNIDAACFYARDVFPLVRTQIPQAEFWIVGRDPTPEVQALTQQPGVHVTGTVPDIRPYFEQATMIVVPLRYGSGVRNKILEAWAMEKPVLSTIVGAEGLDYQDGENIIIADQPRDLADKTIALLRDPILREKIRGGGRQLVQEQHSPQKMGQKYYQILNDAYQRNRPGASAMRVLIDLRWMIPGHAGGIENLSRSFLKEISVIDDQNHYRVLVPSVTKYDLDIPYRKGNIEVIATDGPGKSWKKVSTLLRRKANYLLNKNEWRSDEVNNLIDAHQLNVDVALSTSGYIFPDAACLRNVVVLPDLQHEYHPEFFTPEELSERRAIYCSSLKKASQVIAISEFTRQSAIDILGMDPERISTGHLAADLIYLPENQAGLDVGAILNKYKLPTGGYLFFPGNTWPHKNHVTAVRMLQLLRDEYKLTLPLICTGSAKSAQKELVNQIQQAGLEDQVRFLGYIPLQDMPALYQGAAAMVFPSLFEGFGIPLVEAMWCGCPVVCSNTTSLPEIAGEAAILVDPLMPEAWASAVDRLLHDSTLRSCMIEKGRQRAPEFSYAKFTLEVLRALRGAFDE